MKIITKMKAMKREIEGMNEIYVNIFDSNDNVFDKMNLSFSFTTGSGYEKYYCVNISDIENINKSEFSDYDTDFDESIKYNNFIAEIESEINAKIISYEFYFAECKCSKMILTTEIYANHDHDNFISYCRECGYPLGVYTYTKIEDEIDAEEYINQIDDNKKDYQSVKILKQIYNL